MRWAAFGLGSPDWSRHAPTIQPCRRTNARHSNLQYIGRKTAPSGSGFASAIIDAMVVQEWTIHDGWNRQLDAL